MIYSKSRFDCLGSIVFSDRELASAEITYPFLFRGIRYDVESLAALFAGPSA